MVKRTFKPTKGQNLIHYQLVGSCDDKNSEERFTIFFDKYRSVAFRTIQISDIDEGCHSSWPTAEYITEYVAGRCRLLPF